MMKERQITNTVNDLRRLRQVVRVLVDEGLSLVVDGISLRYLDPVSARIHRTLRQPDQKKKSVPPPVRLRRVFERLGPTYIKFGQIMSTRPDVLPAEFISELVKLQDRVPQVRISEIRAEVERELGQPINRIFREFESKPIAAASLAQVHKAVLLDGTRVAVKVRRPGIVRTIRTDIRILIHFASLMEKHLDWSRCFRPVKMAREFADWTLRELDFEQEGANIARFAAAFRDNHDLVVPEVRWEFTTSGVLVAELIEGIRIDDLDALDRAGIDRLELARIGLNVGFRQFMVYGFFHADPHPGNLTAIPPKKKGGRPRLGIYDFGMVGQLSEKIRFEMVSCFLAFVEKNEEKYVKHILGLAESTEGADLDTFRKEASAMLTGILWKPTQHKRMGQVFYEVILAAARSGVLFSRELILVGKAMITLENVGLGLYPEINLDEEVSPFLKEVFRREFDPRRLSKQAASEAFDTLYSMKHLPEDVRAVIDRLARGEIGVRMDMEELRGLKEEFDRQNDIRVMAIVAAASLLASAIAAGADGLIGLLGKVGFVAAIFLIGWTFIMVGRRPQL